MSVGVVVGRDGDRGDDAAALAMGLVHAHGFDGALEVMIACPPTWPGKPDVLAALLASPCRRRLSMFVHARNARRSGDHRAFELIVARACAGHMHGALTKIADDALLSHDMQALSTVLRHTDVSHKLLDDGCGGGGGNL